MFDEIGLKISIEQLAATIYKTDKLYVDTEIEYIDGTLEPKAELNIYRIIQEALSNTRKYAEAESAKIMIKQFNKTLTVTIKDNGKGFDVLDVLKSGKAFGLLSINQRCKLLKTEASFDSNSYGTTISFEIKLNHV
jgi:signal transduction histidine kinase